MSCMISVITGSHRSDPESARVASYVQGVLRDLAVAKTYYLNLSESRLPLWDEGAWSGEGHWSELWDPVSSELQASDGFVIVSPEWSGMVPSGLKNFFLLCSRNELAHKPALIVTVSAGLGGSYPVAELRMSSYKNTRICYIPDHVIVRHVGQMLHGDEPASEEDATIRARIAYSVRVLLEYAQAMRPLRASEHIDLTKYPYGM